MASRNPDESPEEDERNKALQSVHAALPIDENAPAAPGQQSAPVLEASQGERLDAKPELDRVEIYLRGPTVFTA